MVLEHIDALNGRRIVLASGSPRRLSILEGIGLRNVEVSVSDFAEDLDKSTFATGAEYALATAGQKASDVLHRLCDGAEAKQPPVDILIAADTVVTLAGPPLAIIEKARDAAHARQLLQQLSGQVHEVSTGVVLYYRSRHEDGRYARRTLSVVTRVHMMALSDALLDAYLAVPTYWQGKAGAYGIQDGAGSFIRGIEGDYYNVMGLPLCRLAEELSEIVERELLTE